ncbi:DDE-type integrase/transposase/recombinase [Fervidobacterium changbaicum]|uniref:DDE-type integrase/transposase/recombinase n=1 Tax=Fervidobacterium changbaicum TaxID=310769 RepID=UPI001F513BBE|nr:DDE-type integrase/transposase/recombinase [Fervidobacterium changbaicum]
MKILSKNINQLVVSLGRNMCESKFALLKDFFRFMQGLKNTKNLSRYTQYTFKVLV